MESTIATDVMFLTLVKKIWEMLKETYAHEKNISWVFEIYEWLFSLQQGDQSVQDLYTFLRAFMDAWLHNLGGNTIKLNGTNYLL